VTSAAGPLRRFWWWMTATMLRQLVNEVAVANDGLAALDEAERVRPDVILTDVGMPRPHGLNATRRIRQTGWGRHREPSREAGCDGHLVEAVDPAD
jgi:DNA-binding LytR/AlgR family response regulator